MSDALKVIVGVALLFTPVGWWTWIANLAGSALIMSGLAEDPPPDEGAEGALANQNSNKTYIPVIYGTRRLGGTRVFVSTRGANNKFFDLVLVVSEGPIKGFRTIYLDDAWLHFQDTTIAKWKKGTRRGGRDDGPNSGQDLYTNSYNSGTVVFHNGVYWAAQGFQWNIEPSYSVPSNWLETIPAGVSTLVDDAGSDVSWTSDENGRTYLQVVSVTSWLAGKYVTGDTSGATALISSVDAGNNRLYVANIVPNSTTDFSFSSSETLTETTNRGGTATGQTATGTAPMVVVEPQYFKEDINYTVSGELLPSSSDKTNKNSDEYKNLVILRFHNGSTTQVSDTALTAAQPNWTGDHRLRGKAYIYARFEYNKDRMTGVPNLTAVIDGNLVYDPRDTLTKFESNPALCVRDYLTNSYFGRGIDAASLDDNSIIAAANYCDEVLTVTDTEYEGSPTGGTIYVGDRYNCNARLDTGQTILNNTKQLLLSMRGYLVFSGGLYKLLPDKVTSSYHTFDERNIIGGLNVSLNSKRNTFNEIKITFPNPLKNWESDTINYFSDSIKSTLDNNLSLIKNVTTNSITNPHQALYIALQELKQSRQQVAISFKSGIEGTLVETGDVIRVRSLLYGWGTKTDTVDGETVNVYNTRTGANVAYHDTEAGGVLLGDDSNPMYKEFKVLSVSLDPKTEITISALEYDPTVYTTVPATIIDSSPNTNMVDTRISLPPENLQIFEYLYLGKNTSGFKVALQVSWDTSLSPWDQSYELRINEPYDNWVSGNGYSVGNIVVYNGLFYECNTVIAIGITIAPNLSSDWTNIDEDLDVIHRYKALGVTEDRNFTIKDVKEGWHTIQVRSVNVVGKLSDPATISHDVIGLFAPPKSVSGLGIIINNDVAVLSWNKATDLDVLVSGSIQIRHSPITDLSGYTNDLAIETLWQNSLILTEGKSGATTQVFLPLIVGTYLIKFIDASGVESLVPSTIVNFIAPSGAFNLVASKSELLDFEFSSFDGLTNPADPAGASTGLEKTQNNNVDKLQFRTQGFNLAIVATTDIILLIPTNSITTAPLTITFITDALPLTNSNVIVITANLITVFIDSISIIPTNTITIAPLEITTITNNLPISNSDVTVSQPIAFGSTSLVQAASYYLYNSFEFTSLVDAALSVEVDMEAYDPLTLVSLWVDIDSLTSIDNPALSSNTLAKLSVTQDDPLLLTAVWSTYFSFLTGSVKCRGARALVEISVDTPTTQVLIDDIRFIFDGKDRTEVVSNLVWDTADFALGYKDVFFLQPFFDGSLSGTVPVVPVVSITLSSSIGGIVATLSNGAQVYEGGPGLNGPDTYAGFRIIISRFSALNTTTVILNSQVGFSYRATGF